MAFKDRWLLNTVAFRTGWLYIYNVWMASKVPGCYFAHPPDDLNLRVLRMIEATFSLNSASLSHKVDMTCGLRRELRQNGFHLPSEKWGLLKLERFLPPRSEFFPFKVCPTSPTNVLMNMNRLYCTCHKDSKRFAIESDRINIFKTKSNLSLFIHE